MHREWLVQRGGSFAAKETYEADVPVVGKASATVQPSHRDFRNRSALSWIWHIVTTVLLFPCLNLLFNSLKKLSALANGIPTAVDDPMIRVSEVTMDRIGESSFRIVHNDMLLFGF